MLLLNTRMPPEPSEVCETSLTICPKHWIPLQELRSGLLWVVEQIPGRTAAADMTSVLERGYWPSYNVPYFKEVWGCSHDTSLRHVFLQLIAPVNIALLQQHWIGISCQARFESRLCRMETWVCLPCRLLFP